MGILLASVIVLVALIVFVALTSKKNPVDNTPYFDGGNTFAKDGKLYASGGQIVDEATGLIITE